MGEVLVPVGVRAIPFGIAAVVLGFILKSAGTQAGPADIGSRGPGISVFGTIHPDIFRLRTPVGSQLPVDRIYLANLDMQTGFDDPPASFDERFGSIEDRLVTFDKRVASIDDRLTSFDKRFESRPTSFKRVASLGDTSAFALIDESEASFDERFGSALGNRTASVQLPPDREIQKSARSMNRPGDSSPAAGESKTHVRPGQARKDPAPSADDGRTAIYDITARVVYLPNGRRLEAHSGLGSLMDNPRHAHVRMRGSTPPNVYKLSLRERPFHGVRAIRLTPMDEGKMHGRAGILAHSYMLGPNGQSNGCVSFGSYPEFLNAYLRGEITRLVVVERLDNPPAPKVASGWLSNAVRNLFGGSDSNGQYADASSY